uniref:Uncharacterized protein n=1 Tax=Graphocephala atropunctata TaxID=36148 RepID=A0A1B6LAM6_9HEMI
MGTNPERIFQQSVTMTAKMWPQGNNTMPESSWEWGWRVPPHHWPLLVAMFCGGALVLLLVVTAVLWHCCVAPHRNKDYRVKMDGESLSPRNVVPVLPSHSAVFVEPKYRQWSYSSRLVTPQHWFYNRHLIPMDSCNVPRSLSVPTTGPVITRQSSPSRVVFPDSGSGPSSLPVPLPHISEFSPGAQYASSSFLDEFGSRDLYPSVGGVMLKTQSLPACVRSRPRPLSTSDDLSELYAKVNFSKKRKNRMRNDEAAIIALSKSRSQFLHKDTDSLVDNEAVIVYDERTAL